MKYKLFTLAAWFYKEKSFHAKYFIYSFGKTAINWQRRQNEGSNEMGCVNGMRYILIAIKVMRRAGRR